ncbi:MAG: DUF4389 domain-containing protein [Candidatus Acidoferrales bacterium]
MTNGENGYPARLAIDYPDRHLKRWSTLLRIVYAIPILIVLALVGGNGGGSGGATAGGQLVLGPLVMILFRRKYPRWWFDWNLEFLRFVTRVFGYLLLLDDRYPATDADQSVQLELDYPDVPQELNRWLPLVKWILALPHYAVLFVLWVVVVLSVVAAWFAILATGRYPRGLFDFVVGVMRWTLRVNAYAFLLTTDRYPPFSTE